MRTLAQSSFSNTLNAMRNSHIWYFLTSLVPMSLALQAESLVELNDGTRIVGEVVSASQGRYLIRSLTLGEVELDEASIQTIRPTGNGVSNENHRLELATIQQKIANSPELIQMISALQSDPGLQEVLNDRHLLERVLAGNMETVMRDPRVLRLLANPSVQAIIGKVNGPIKQAGFQNCWQLRLSRPHGLADPDFAPTAQPHPETGPDYCHPLPIRCDGLPK